MLKKLQERWAKAHERQCELARALERVYGKTWMAPGSKQARHDAASKRAGEAMEAIFVWLDANSPRDWRHGVPAFWVCQYLTQEDALTRGRLSVVPPPCYDGCESDSIRFANAIN